MANLEDTVTVDEMIERLQQALDDAKSGAPFVEIGKATTDPTLLNLCSDGIELVIAQGEVIKTMLGHLGAAHS